MGLSALGLNQWFLRQVDETLEPGRAALFVVVSGGADHERVIEALQPLAPRVLRTNLDSPRAAPPRASRSRSPASDVAFPYFGVTNHACCPALSSHSLRCSQGSMSSETPVAHGQKGFTHLSVVLRR